MGSCLICGKKAQHVAEGADGTTVTCSGCGRYACHVAARTLLAQECRDPDVLIHLQEGVRQWNEQGREPTIIKKDGILKFVAAQDVFDELPEERPR